jgi:hypothetical protein
MRLFAALEGAIWGGATATLVLAIGIAVVRRRGGWPALLGAAPAIWPPGHLGLPGLLVLLGLGGVLAGAAARAGRRIPLARCARIADAALDGQDRVFSAWCLERQAASPLVAALVADAVESASRLAPARVVPARRPQALPALGLTAIALGGAVLFPISSHAARSPRRVPVVAPLRPLAPGTIDAERDEARAALAEAASRGDGRLTALAMDFERTLRELSAGSLEDGQALERLRVLEARAAEAAQDAERDGRAAHAAAKALVEDAATRAAGQAFAAGDDGSSERARAALGASAREHPMETGQALAAAERGVAQSSGDADAAGSSPGKRRLARDAAGADAPPVQIQPASESAGERRLEQLRRDLRDAASACGNRDPSCSDRAQSGAQDLARLGRQAATADGLRHLERAVGQLRARVGRGELRDSDALAARDFARAANGPGREQPGDGANDRPGQSGGSAAPERSASSQGESAGAGQGDGAGEDGSSGSSAAAGAQLSAVSQAEGTGAEPSDGTGDGIGKQPGGAPLGRRDDRPTEGNDTQVNVANGAGPTRAEVIGAAAGGGFAARGYARVFTDYAAAVEDALGTTAVPAGQRFIVRRYFDLIRPRERSTR